MITRGLYYTDNSDLLMQVVKVGYRYPDGERIKAKVALYAKSDKRMLQSAKNYKLNLKMISHWRRYVE